MPRFAYGDPSRLPNLISELLAANVDVLYVTPRAIPDAVRITKTVPIVSMGFADPVAEGFVASLARPGKNLTGISEQSIDTAGKRLELAMDIVPSLKGAAVLLDPGDKRTVGITAFQALAAKQGIK